MKNIAHINCLALVISRRDCLVLIFVFSDMFFGVYKKQITDRKLNQLFMERGVGLEGA
jgi:hypothetical protein